MPQAITVADMMGFASNLAQMFIYNAKLAASFLVCIAEIARAQGYIKISQCIMGYGEKCIRIFLSVSGAIAVAEIIRFSRNLT